MSLPTLTPEPPRPASAANPKSVGGGASTYVNFINHLDVDAKVFWFDYSGARALYATLKPGVTRRQQTYIGHPWEVSAETQYFKLQPTFLPLNSESKVIINKSLMPTLAPQLPIDNLHSVDGGVSTYIDFVNNLDTEIKTHWVDYDGKRVLYSSIQPGSSFRQQTYVGHPWEVTISSRTSPIAVFHPAEYEALAVLDRDVIH
ncbi:hypothetical protein Hypma_006421 [Hypsizygus marmoreus]|uniref:von Hippel-Lindau disease tumour suppressor beta domain-containing protein n=1 Tax=Hypsizygus marmoreus TaxID=39966 RepID=A0A369K381_HYPMA|nr:hypothetical protein Hypma_006421 [Hypsizygus marmoreus]